MRAASSNVHSPANGGTPIRGAEDMRSSLVKCAFILIALAAACNAPDKQEAGTQAAPGSADADRAVVHHPEPPSRPSEKLDSIPMEGTFNRFKMKLVQPQAEPRFS